MTTRFVVLLRGVNVGGVTVRSADLREALAGAGLQDVRTVLASGNALVTADSSVPRVRAEAEAALLRRYEREVRVVVRSQDDVAALVTDCPYPADSETHHAYVVLFEEPGAVQAAYDRLAPLVEPDGPESVAAGDGVIYWWCPRGSSLATPVARATAPRGHEVLTTTRNVRTLRRLTTG